MGITRSKFKKELLAVIADADYYVKDEDIEKFLDLNYDEDSSLAQWNYSEFSSFKHELCHEWGNFWDAVKQFDLHYPEEIEEEIEDDDRDEKPWDYGKHFN